MRFTTWGGAVLLFVPLTSFLPGAASAFFFSAARPKSVCHLSQVSDDIGEALVTGAMEAAGVAGPSRGQVPSHRMLYCSTAEGKVRLYCNSMTERVWGGNGAGGGGGSGRTERRGNKGKNGGGVEGEGGTEHREQRPGTPMDDKDPRRDHGAVAVDAPCYPLPSPLPPDLFLPPPSPLRLPLYGSWSRSCTSTGNTPPWTTCGASCPPSGTSR